MGIMVTYGSYMKKENNLESSVRQIEIFDTAIAFLAGIKHTFWNSIYTDRKGIFVQIKFFWIHCLAYIAFYNKTIIHSTLLFKFTWQ